MLTGAKKSQPDSEVSRLFPPVYVPYLYHYFTPCIKTDSYTQLYLTENGEGGTGSHADSAASSSTGTSLPRYEELQEDTTRMRRTLESLEEASRRNRERVDQLTENNALMRFNGLQEDLGKMQKGLMDSEERWAQVCCTIYHRKVVLLQPPFLP
jgi:hypothetical protein